MTFSQLKTEILNRAKLLDICEAYQEVLLSSTEQELIDAGLNANIISWAYESGVVDADLLSEFSQSTLNANGIYTTGTPTITNPVKTIYLLEECDATITVNGALKLKLILLGIAKAHLTLSDFAHASVSVAASGWMDLTTNGDASTCGKLIEDGQAVVTANNRSVVHLRLQDGSKLTYQGNDESYAKLNTYHNTITNINGNAGLSINSYGKFQPNYGAPL